jgi:hypothetical protein
MNRHRTTRYRFTGSALPRTRRWSLGLAAIVMLTTLLAVTGTASAGTAKSSSSSTVYSAAHAQYGPQHVVTPQASKPPVSGVLHAQAAKPKVHAVVAKTVPAQKVSGTLPFTGVSLLGALLFGLAMVALGVILRRQPSRSSDK